jgi:hypothetical protein
MRLATSTGLLCALLAGAAAFAAEGDASATKPWKNDYTTRLEALALLQSLNANLLSNSSATLTLDRWCESHRLAAPAKVVAERVRDVNKEPTPDQRTSLGVSATEPVRYRRVRLRCGEHVLSEADNWYVPARLTPEMNQALDTSDIAFGRAVQDLKFRRQTVSATLLWSPLPEGWEMGAALESPGQKNDAKGSLKIPSHVLQHRAVLTLPDGTPISQVVETYTSEVLGFPEPPHP